MSLDFLDFGGEIGTVYHDMINATLGRGNSVIPHEWYFLNIFIKNEILKNRKLATIFAMFVFQYYPNYAWRYFSIVIKGLNTS